jgi:DNA-directed RNA polymerase subunit M/transcription elongation factor TFIIS
MHTQPMSERQGELDAEKRTDRKCPKCGVQGQCVYQTWESSCGGYEDEKHTCRACGHVWWIEGPDS